MSVKNLIPLLTMILLLSPILSLLVPNMPGYSISENNNSLRLELFLDPHCIDSMNFWLKFEPVLTEEIDDRNEVMDLISLRLHMFGLPYHHNSFFACQVLNFLENKSPIEYLCFLKKMFLDQKKYNKDSSDHSEDYIKSQLITSAKNCLAAADINVETLFKNSSIIQKSRIAFKFASERGIFEYPTLLVNGFPVDVSKMDEDSLFTFIKELIDGNRHPKNRELKQKQAELF